jgi:outer membrane protein
MEHIKHQYFFKYFVLSFLGIAFSGMSLSAQELLTLKRATELVIENNLQIKQAQLRRLSLMRICSNQN